LPVVARKLFVERLDNGFGAGHLFLDSGFGRNRGIISLLNGFGPPFKVGHQYIELVELSRFRLHVAYIAQTFLLQCIVLYSQYSDFLFQLIAFILFVAILPCRGVELLLGRMLLSAQLVYLGSMLFQRGFNDIEFLLRFPVLLVETLDIIEHMVELLPILRELAADACSLILYIPELLIFDFLFALVSPYLGHIFVGGTLLRR